jgi:hypothetical protein
LPDRWKAEHQVHSGVAPDVDHERDGGPDGRDVREALVRSDADVGAAPDAIRAQVADGVQV